MSPEIEEMGTKIKNHIKDKQSRVWEWDCAHKTTGHPK